MKRNHALLAALATALAAASLTGCGERSTPANVIPEGTTVSLAVPETTDIHSNVLGYNYYSLADDAMLGLDRTPTLIQQARAENPNNLLFDDE